MRDKKGRYVKGCKVESGGFKKGYTPWNKGKHIWSKAERLKRSKMMSGKNHPLYGTHPSTETIKKLIQSHKGKNTGPQNHNWKGGISKTTQGYIEQMLSFPTTKRRYRLQHRLIVEVIIGRRLLRKESVHHVNGIKSDNRPQNLMAFITEPVHKKFERTGNVQLNEIIFDGRKI